jgi:hypothetical protein
MALTFNREAGMAFAAAKVERALDRGLNDMTAIAIEKAPVRKDRSSKSTRRNEDAVRTIRENFIGDNARASTFRANSSKVRRVSSLRVFRELLSQGVGPERAAKGALGRARPGSFTFKFVNERTGEEVTNLSTRRGRLTARAAVRGGNLKSKIRRTEIEIDGNRIEGKLISGAPYSAPMEYGFEHVGGTHVPARPFMRPAKAHYKANWRTYFNGSR